MVHRITLSAWPKFRKWMYALALAINAAAATIVESPIDFSAITAELISQVVSVTTILIAFFNTEIGAKSDSIVIKKGAKHASE